MALDDSSTLIGTMKWVLGQIGRNVQVHNNPQSFAFEIHWDQLDRLEKMIEEYENSFGSFRRLQFVEMWTRNPIVQDGCKKRGLIDILWIRVEIYVWNRGFWDVKRLTAVCDELYALEAQMVRAADYQLTYLRTLNETTKRNTMDTIELARMLRDSIGNFCS